MPPDSPPVAAPAPDAPVPSPPHQPGLLELFLAFAKMSLAGFGGVLVWARRAIVEQHRWMTAEEFNETFALCHFLPGPNIVNLSVVFGSRFRGIAGGLAAFAGLVGPPMVIATILAALYARYGDIDVLRRTLAGVACAAVGLLFAVVFKMMMPLLKRRDVTGLVILAAVFVAIGLIRWPLQIVLLVAIPLSIATTVLARRMVRGMSSESNPIAALVWTFGLMSLFAVGGANSAIPEMHRAAVDVHHWLTDKQFADVFAISQLSPGPNVLIVTLIGYSVAGVAGALAATVAMCGPTALLAYYVSRFLDRSREARWPAMIQAALVPLSIGLMAASGLIVAQTSDQSWIAVLITIVAAALAFATRINPLWMLLAGGLLGFAGVI
ncbi:putative chromate ion transporter [Bradyrhizobium sp. USDA 4513]